VSHVRHTSAPGPAFPRLHPATLRAALWAWRACRAARRGYAGGLDHPARLPRVPDVPLEASRGVHGVVTRTGATCLVAARVRQEWEAAHGHRRDLIIGVSSPSAGFRAHAWLEGDPPCQGGGLTELVRR
jgi:hypothetical protein